MDSNIIHQFLVAFFNMFNAHVNDFKIEEKSVTGNVRWKDDNEIQNFLWVIESKEKILKRLTVLCNFLIEHNYLRGDKIIITENELQKQLIELGWNLNEAQKNIDYLCAIEIKMIDFGEITDSFYIHF